MPNVVRHGRSTPAGGASRTPVRSAARSRPRPRSPHWSRLVALVAPPPDPAPGPRLVPRPIRVSIDVAGRPQPHLVPLLARPRVTLAVARPRVVAQLVEHRSP